jgi:caffeoyl-CoA O-methyltransferase
VTPVARGRLAGAAEIIYLRKAYFPLEPTLESNSRKRRAGMLSLVAEELVRYCEAHSTPESALLQSLAEETQAKTEQPQMQVGPLEGLFLKLLVRAMGARRVLEIGTFTGYSTLMLASGLPENGEVITCDIDRKATGIAQAFWDRSPFGKRITLEIGPALETLETLRAPFDLVFIDADKPNYIAYWEACVPKLRPCGILLADNVLWSGRVLDPQEQDDRAIAAFNEHVSNDSRVDTVMLTVRDGITMACKR